MGAPHNILRHPDMPAVAFEDLWTPWRPATLVGPGEEPAQERRPLLGTRPRQPDQGERQESPAISRSAPKPGRDEVAFAEALYQDVREGRAKGIYLKEGRLLHTGWRGVTENFQNMSLRARLAVPSA